MTIENGLRYEVYDDENKLIRKFSDRQTAEKFLQTDWKLVTKAKVKPINPTPETHGEARW